MSQLKPQNWHSFSDENEKLNSEHWDDVSYCSLNTELLILTTELNTTPVIYRVFIKYCQLSQIMNHSSDSSVCLRHSECLFIRAAGKAEDHMTKTFETENVKYFLNSYNFEDNYLIASYSEFLCSTISNQQWQDYLSWRINYCNLKEKYCKGI